MQLARARNSRACRNALVGAPARALRGSVAVSAVRSYVDSMGRVGRGCRRVFPAHVELAGAHNARSSGSTGFPRPCGISPVASAPRDFAARLRAHNAVLGRSFVGSKNGTRATSASTSPSLGSSAFTQVPRFQCERGITASAMLHPAFGDQKALVT